MGDARLDRRLARGAGARPRASVDAGHHGWARRSQILLHATEAGLKLYRELGFRETGTVRQYQSATFRAGLALPSGQRLRPIGRSDPPAIAELDRIASGMQRGELMTALIESGETVILDKEGTVAGFAILRPFGRGSVIGPVLAPDVTGAQAMILHFLGLQLGRFVRIRRTRGERLDPVGARDWAWPTLDRRSEWCGATTFARKMGHEHSRWLVSRWVRKGPSRH